MLNVGLTGNVAAGKTAVADHFARWGATVIDADRIVHDLQAPGSPVFDNIVGHFGDDIVAPDGRLDRPRLRHLVMGDPAARADLNRIVHPAVQQERDRLIDAARAAGDCVLVNVIPLLFEVLDPSTFDAIVLVDAPPPIRRRRLTIDRGLETEDAERLMASQLDSRDKHERSDFVINNDGTPTDLESAAWHVWKALRKRAARGTTAGGRLIAVFAHPDDESLAVGGTLARYADAGIAVHLVCATDGAAGTMRDLDETSDVAHRRVEDLRRAARILGVHSVHLLGFADGALDPTDARGAEAVGAILAETAPDAVITFGADGITGHADHLAVHHWTTRAWVATGSPGQLYYVGYPDAVADRFPVPIHGIRDADVSASIDVRPWADLKRAAIAAHSTQRLPFALDDQVARALFDREWYARAGDAGRPGDDLFGPAERA